MALADDVADFNAAAEIVASHYRVAIGYLRTGNIELARLEIDRTREAWGALQQHFAGRRPDVFAGNRLYNRIYTGVSARLVGAELLLNAGRPDAAADSLNAVRDDLYALRKSAGIAVLADCIRDANTAMDALMIYNNQALDWDKPDVRDGLAGRATAYGTLLDRCDGMADSGVKQAGEFRRLVDGARASLAQIPKAIATRDADLLHRLLIELRSFDNLLAFRYG
ncbi:MAG TPA: hypothetical protein VFW22_12830 [Pseudolabrys sp.]|nr:hypothetical protein [Pseudolabrys sp.]